MDYIAKRRELEKKKEEEARKKRQESYSQNKETNYAQLNQQKNGQYTHINTATTDPYRGYQLANKEKLMDLAYQRVMNDQMAKRTGLTSPVDALNTINQKKNAANFTNSIYMNRAINAAEKTNQKQDDGNTGTKIGKGIDKDTINLLISANKVDNKNASFNLPTREEKNADISDITYNNEWRRPYNLRSDEIQNWEQQKKNESTKKYIQDVINNNTNAAQDVLKSFSANYDAARKNTALGFERLSYDIGSDNREEPYDFEKYIGESGQDFRESVNNTNRINQVQYDDPRNYNNGDISDRNRRGTAIELAQSFGNNAPSYMIGGVVTAMTGNKEIGNKASSIALGLQAGLSAYEEARSSGYDIGKSFVYASEEGLSEFYTDALLGAGGNFASSKLGKTVSELAGNALAKTASTPLGKSVLNALTRVAAGMTSEAAQEFLQYYTELGSKYLILGEKDSFSKNGNALDNFNNAIHAAQLGAYNALLMQGGNEIVNFGIMDAYGNASTLQKEAVTALRDSLDLDVNNYKTKTDLLKAQNLKDVLDSVSVKLNNNEELSNIDKFYIEQAMTDLAMPSVDENGNVVTDNEGNLKFETQYNENSFNESNITGINAAGNSEQKLAGLANEVAADKIAEQQREQDAIDQQALSNVVRQNQAMNRTDENTPVKDSTGTALSSEQQNKLKGTAVVDNNGNAIKALHGSPTTNIEEFDVTRAGQNSGNPGDKAIWFTDSEEYADEFSYERKAHPNTSHLNIKGAKGQVYEAYLNMQNPFDLRNITDDMRQLMYESQTFYDNENDFNNDLDTFLKAGNHQGIKTFLDYDVLKSAGYDGIIANMDTKRPGAEYGVFDNSQIVKTNTPSNTAAKTVGTLNAKSVTSQNVSENNTRISSIEERAKQFPESVGNVYIDNYNGGDIVNYDENMKKAYQAGIRGESYATLSNDASFNTFYSSNADAVDAMWRVGTAVRNEIQSGGRVNVRRENVSGTGAGRNVPFGSGKRTGEVSRGAEERTDTGRGKRSKGSAERLSKVDAEKVIPNAKQGQKVEIIHKEQDTKETAETRKFLKDLGVNNVVLYNSEKEVELNTGEKARAYYDAKTDTIGVQSNNKKEIQIALAKHEAIERAIKSGRLDPMDVFNKISETVSVGDLTDMVYAYLSKNINNLSESEKNIAYQKAIKEFVCDACSGINQFRYVEQYRDMVTAMYASIDSADEIANDMFSQSYKMTVGNYSDVEYSVNNPEGTSAYQRKNIQFNKDKTDDEFGTKLKTVAGTPIYRYGSTDKINNGVGKKLSYTKEKTGEKGSQVYLHKNYATEVIPKAIYDAAVEKLNDTYPGFKYNTLMYLNTNERDVVRFDEAPDFDTAREPIPGKMVAVNVTDNTITDISENRQIWHHKWLWVKNDYKGFGKDGVKDSWNWSRLWLSVIRDTKNKVDYVGDSNMRIDNKGIANGMGEDGKAWAEQLKYFGLPQEGETVDFDVITKADEFVLDLKRTQEERSNEPQSDTSEGTSLNQIPASMTNYKFYNTDRVLDWGGGRYDTAKNFMEDAYKGIEMYIYDPFNRTKEYNNAVLKEFEKDPANVITINNVLNVINSVKTQESVIKESKEYLSDDGVTIFTIYEGDKSGIGEFTKEVDDNGNEIGASSWQNNLEAAEYVPMIQKYYKFTKTSGNFILASDNEGAIKNRKKLKTGEKFSRAYKDSFKKGDVDMKYATSISDVNNSVEYSVEIPYRFGSAAADEWTNTIHGEARETLDLFSKLHEIGQKNKASVIVGVGEGRHSKTIDVTTRNMLAQEWNEYVNHSETFARTARMLAEELPDDVMANARISKDGHINPTEFEKEFKMQRSFMQRIVDKLPMTTGPQEVTINGKTYKYGNGSEYKIGGEAYRQELLKERRKQYDDGTLAKKSISGLSKDTWGTMGFLASNTKTGSSGDFTTFCPQMFFNKGCWYCYRLSAIKSGVNNKLVGENVWYTGEILRLKQDDIDMLNGMGGLRIQSFGDWMGKYTQQLADMLEDAERVGLQIKIITKEPSMIETVAFLKEHGLGNNLYFNLSADYTIEPVSGEDVKTINSARPYMHKDGKTYWKRALTVEEANEFRNKYPWVNTRIVATNTDEFIRGLQDPWVDVVTGYHGKDFAKSGYERISSETGETLLDVEALGDAGMPRFSYNAKTGTWAREFDGKTNLQKKLADTIEELSLQYNYYVKTCCQTGRCASCAGKCGKLARDFNIKNATNRDNSSVKYWQKNMMADPKLYKFADLLTNEQFQELKDQNNGVEYSTPIMDTDYIKAVESGDIETAQKMVDEAAKKAGYPIKAFHGTPVGGFTKYDFGKGGLSSGVGRGVISLTDNKSIAERYAGNKEKSFKLNKEIDSRKYVDLINSVFYDDRIDTDEIEKSFFYGEEIGEWDYDMLFDSIYDMYDFPTEEDYESKYDYEKAYKDAENKAYYDFIKSELERGLSETTGATKKVINEALSKIDDIKTNSIGEPTVYEWYIPKADKDYYAKNQDEYAKIAREASSDGARVSALHLQDEGTRYFVKSNKDIKSADPVTYDDNGNVIPLSERFNDKNDDIRYSYSIDGETPSPENTANRERLYEYLSKTDRSMGYPHASEWRASRVGADKNPMALSDIGRMIEQELDLNITTGRIKGKGVRGTYSPLNHGVRSRVALDLPTISHEVGHWFDFKYGKLSNSKMTADVKKELLKAYHVKYGDNDYPASLHVTEGMAEYFRMYLTNSSEAKSKFPKLTEYFLGSMNPKDLASIEQIADEVNAYYANGGDTATSAIRLREDGGRDFRTYTDRIKERGSEFYQAWVDSLASIKEFDKSIGSNAYIGAVNSLYSDAISGRIIESSLTDKNGKYVAPGLSDALKGVNTRNKTEYLEFNEYLTCIHGQEWLQNVDKDGEPAPMRVFADDRKNTVAFMKKRVKELEAKYPAFKEAAENTIQFVKDLTQTWLVDNGIITQKQFDDLNKKYPNYVPFMRAFDKETRQFGSKRGFANQNSPIKRAKGSGYDIIAPVDSIIDMICKYVNIGTRNNVMLELRNAALKYGADATFMERVDAPRTVSSVNVEGLKESLIESLHHMGVDTDSATKVENLINNIDDVLMQFGKGTKDKDNTVVTVIAGGEKEFWKVNDPALLESLTSMTPNKTNGLLALYGATTRFLTANITGNNVVWSIFSNAPRDLLTFSVYTKDRNVGHILKALGSTYLNAAKEWTGKGTVDPLYSEYLAMGGGHSSAYSADMDLAKNARKSLTDSTLSRIMHFANPIEVVSFISDTVEQGPRFATYKMCRQKGMNQQQAFYEAMDVTVNFRKSGANSKMVGKVIPFFNASVQGLDKFNRFFTADDVKGNGRAKAAATRFGVYVAASAALAMLTYAFNNRDDDDKKDYQQLSTYIKNNYFVFQLGDGKYFALPKARELSVITSLFTAGIEYVEGENKHAFDDFYTYATEAFLPDLLNEIVDFPYIAKTQSLSAALDETINNTLGNLGIVGVAHNVYANRDFLGRPIVNSSFTYKKTPRRDQWTESTSKLARLIGQALNLSPQKIDYVGNQVLGYLWQTQQALWPIGDQYVDKTLGVKNKYFKDNQYSLDIINWMYDERDKERPDSVESEIEYRYDNNMCEFYSEFNKKNKLTGDRNMRQAVIDMIFQYRKDKETGETDPVKKVNDYVRESGNYDVLPGVMKGTVKNKDTKVEYTLTDKDYYDYQTKYNAYYWEYVENVYDENASLEDRGVMLENAKALAKERATEEVANKFGFSNDNKYSDLPAEDVIKFKTGLNKANDDGSTTNDEIMDIALEMIKSGTPDDVAGNLYYGRTEDKYFQEWSGSTEDYLNYKQEIADLKAENKDKGLSTEDSKKEVAKEIKSYGISEEAAKVLWEIAGYSVDSTKNGKTIEDGNFDKYFSTQSFTEIRGNADFHNFLDRTFDSSKTDQQKAAETVMEIDKLAKGDEISMDDIDYMYENLNLTDEKLFQQLLVYAYTKLPKELQKYDVNEFVYRYFNGAKPGITKHSGVYYGDKYNIAR